MMLGIHRAAEGANHAGWATFSGQMECTHPTMGLSGARGMSSTDAPRRRGLAPWPPRRQAALRSRPKAGKRDPGGWT
jgi:hypothetical protein